MAKTHALLAVLPTKLKTAMKIADEAIHTFGAKPERFQAQRKTYTPVDLENGRTHPTEDIPMSSTVREKLDWVRKSWQVFMDCEYQRDVTNTTAKADLVFDGITIPDLPVTFLMQLEKQLTKLRQVYGSAPTLDPSVSWDQATDFDRPGVHQAPALERDSEEFTITYPVVLQPTAEHPGQYVEKKVASKTGTWKHQKWSGELTLHEKADILGRVDILLEAVRKAKSEANNDNHCTDKVAEVIFDYLHTQIPVDVTT